MPTLQTRRSCSCPGQLTCLFFRCAIGSSTPGGESCQRSFGVRATILRSTPSPGALRSWRASHHVTGSSQRSVPGRPKVTTHAPGLTGSPQNSQTMTTTSPCSPVSPRGWQSSREYQPSRLLKPCAPVGAAQRLSTTPVSTPTPQHHHHHHRQHLHLYLPLPPQAS